MKVYAITKDHTLVTFLSIAAFELEHSWIDNDFITCVASRDLDGEWQETNEGHTIKLNQDELLANAMLNKLSKK